MSNLPNWKHASKVYSRAYTILANMAKAGHAVAPVFKRNKIVKQAYVSDEMLDFIKALDKGDEEEIKWHILNNIHHLKGDNNEQ